MTKVQMFASDNAQELLNLINNFIANKKVVDIKFNSLTYSTEFKNGTPNNIFVNDRVLIIYEED